MRRRRPLVAIVWPWVSHYRRPFYDQLRQRLDALGVDLLLLHGTPEGSVAEKQHTVEPGWGEHVDNRTIRVAGRELLWQPALGLVRRTDLVIVQQTTRQLLTYVLLAAQAFGGPKVALWGHGRNWQVAEATGASEAIKGIMSRRAHWCFAYNELSAEAFREHGVPDGRITVVQNAIDTRALRAARRELLAETVQDVRRALRLAAGPVGLCCGSLYPAKRPEFLVAVADAVRGAVDGFQLIVVGGGRSDGVIREAAAQRRWLHYVGPRFGVDRVPYFALADVVLFPGLVGLGVLDCFALEVPLVASLSASHSPEIDYVDNGSNGILVDDGGDPQRYARAIAEVLRDDALRLRLVEGCRKAQEVYTIEAMVERFAHGVVAALGI